MNQSWEITGIHVDGINSFLLLLFKKRLLPPASVRANLIAKMIQGEAYKKLQ